MRHPIENSLQQNWKAKRAIFSVKETSLCIVDDTGRTVWEVKVASEPEALLQVLGNTAYRFKRLTPTGRLEKRILLCLANCPELAERDLTA